MTANQIAYSKVVEDRRHNKVYEYETARHNTELEGIGWQQAAAASRSADAAMAHAGAAYLGAQASMYGAQASMLAAQETAAHYQRQDTLTQEWNAGMLAVNQQNANTQRLGTVGQNVIGFFNAATNRKQSNTASAQQQETARHNKVSEGLELSQVGARNFSNIARGVRDIGQVAGDMITSVGSLIH